MAENYLADTLFEIVYFYPLEIEGTSNSKIIESGLPMRHLVYDLLSLRNVSLNFYKKSDISNIFKLERRTQHLFVYQYDVVDTK